MWAAWTWTIVSLLGAGASGMNLLDSFRDLAAVRVYGVVGGPRWVLARDGLIADAMRLVVLVIFAVIGIGALTIPLNPVYAWVFQYGFLTAGVLVTGNSILARSTRRSMRQHFDITDQKGGKA